MALLRPIVAGIALLALAACGEADGPTVSAPDRGIDGAWVRTVAPGRPNPAALEAAPPPDTVFLYQGQGLWSRQFLVDDGGRFSSRRLCSRVALAVEAPRVLLTMLDQFSLQEDRCPVDEGAFALRGDVASIEPPRTSRPLSMVAGPHYEVLREGRDLLRVRPVMTGLEDSQRYTEWYRRVTWPPVD